MSGIGRLNEKSLHASLKDWYARPGDNFEVSVNNFVIDIVRDNYLIEIQTVNFSAIKRKIKTLLDSQQVRLVYPIAQEKWLLKKPKHDSGKIKRRKSPKKGKIEDIFNELVYLTTIFKHANFTLEILLIREEEIRYYDATRNWRKHGWVTEERRLLEVIKKRVFRKPVELLSLFKHRIPDKFTTQDIAAGMGIKKKLSQKAAYCFRKMGLINLIGKQGRFNLYKFPENIKLEKYL